MDSVFSQCLGTQRTRPLPVVEDTAGETWDLRNTILQSRRRNPSYSDRHWWSKQTRVGSRPPVFRTWLQETCGPEAPNCPWLSLTAHGTEGLKVTWATKCPSETVYFAQFLSEWFQSCATKAILNNILTINEM